MSALHERVEPPWDELDPGIRGFVRSLWDLGFETSDSGDGRSKIGGPMDDGFEVTPWPHVVVVTSGDTVRADCERLVTWGRSVGLEFQVEAHCLADLSWLIYLQGEEMYDPLVDSP